MSEDFKINIYPVCVSDEPDAHRVVLKIDNQGFNIGDYYESLEFAEGMKANLIVALNKMAQDNLDAKDKELEALRNYARQCVNFGIFATTAKSNGLIDESGKQTPLLTGESK